MIRIVLVALTALTFGAACKTTKSASSVKEGFGAASPASVFCDKKGGEFVLMESDAGTSGFCRIDGGLIEEWTMYRYLNENQPSVAIKKFLNPTPPAANSPAGQGHGLANPASVNCESSGGELIMMESDNGTSAACKFADGSKIEEWTLFRGAAGHPGLAAVLKGEPAGGPVGPGGANPASVFCGKKGGVTVMMESDNGTSGFCRIDGGLIEEWTMFRYVTNFEPSIAIEKFLNPTQPAANTPAVQGNGLASPASVNCENVGGELVMMTSDAGTSAACKFADGSQIEEWTLMRGPTAHHRLMLVLNRVDG